MTDIEDIIYNEKAMLSGVLAALIVKNDGVSIEAARKRIERAQSPIHKVRGLFVDNQSFIYHSDYFGSEEYFEKLNDVFEIAGKRCAAIINAIKYHHGLISKTDLANYSFSPIKNIKGHVTFSTLISKLKNIDVLRDYDDNHYELHPYLYDYKSQNLQHYKAIQFTQNLVINQFSQWSRNTGLVSFNTGTLNSEVGGFQFGFTSPSYINGFVQYKDGHPKPGFLAADVVIGNSTKSQDVTFFINKIEAIKGSNKTIRVFPVILIDGVEPTALNQLKQAGVMIGTIRELFGEDYNELLKTLINTITNAGTVLKKDPESYIKLMEQLTKLVDGKTNNLRGDLFELAVGYYYGQYLIFRGC
ncbi:hypothetical protein [Mucilaginibacter sp. 5C4]|uniref:hypothetical protein n=1 Tax=Mucilaginibacter sp. 5C4 TaxID=3048589 RepID=UPI002AC9836A|nr:hypothetical protein [Mucilaginibacter sp. 5C4]MEB0301564.1 hypothetical protein [Mucilaginibacter sp. 5C4]WPX25311.1 hypothetical protein RHM67_08555 [Mucilaginibacter sp. 5C4]